MKKLLIIILTTMGCRGVETLTTTSVDFDDKINSLQMIRNNNDVVVMETRSYAHRYTMKGRDYEKMSISFGSDMRIYKSGHQSFGFSIRNPVLGYNKIYQSSMLFTVGGDGVTGWFENDESIESYVCISKLDTINNIIEGNIHSFLKQKSRKMAERDKEIIDIKYYGFSVKYKTKSPYLDRK